MERKPPTIADIVREKTDDGARIIDFFLDVMEGRVDGAELCHRIDAAKQLVKYGSEEAVIFIAKYKGIPCGHSTRRRGDSPDPCIADERTPVEVTLNAPANLTREFLTVLSGIDEFLMRQLIRAQTADGGTIIDFLYDVMQDTTEGFRTHHRIAAAKELIVHIIRDEQPVRSTVEGPDPTPREPVPEQSWIPADAGTQKGGGARNDAAAPAHTAPGGEPAPAKEGVPGSAGTHPTDPVLSAAEGPALSPAEGPQLETNNSKLETLPARRPRRRRTRKERRRAGNARAATRRKDPGSEHSKEKEQDKPTPVELTPAERRIRERLEQHWHEPDPYSAPIDSASLGRSPP